MELRELVATTNMADIALIKSLLDAEEITYLAQGEHFHAVRPAPGLDPVRFMVPDAELHRAREVLKDVKLSYGVFADFLDRNGMQNEAS